MIFQIFLLDESLQFCLFLLAHNLFSSDLDYATSYTSFICILRHILVLSMYYVSQINI